MFSIYDEKSKSFCPPFYKTNIATAIRDFSDLCKNQESKIHPHPEDYTLHAVGIFSDDTAVSTSNGTTKISAALDHVQSPELISN